MNNNSEFSFEGAENIILKGQTWGNPQNPAVILLHGGGQTLHSWGDTAQCIAEAGYYAIAYDARGHGNSGWSKEVNYGGDFLVEDLKALLKTLPQKKALVGASMGGITALLMQGESKEKYVDAIVLVDIAPKVEQKGIERIFTFMSANLHGFANLEEAAEAVASYLPNRPRPKDTERLRKNLRLKEDGRYYWHWDPALLKKWMSTTAEEKIKNQNRLMKAAKNLSVPTLIVRGGMSDVVSEQVMTEFLDAVPHVRSIDVSGAGHMVAGDSNHIFTKAVLDFLKETF
jgi:non-heme chloroperoxidase